MRRIKLKTSNHLQKLEVNFFVIISDIDSVGLMLVVK